MRTQGMKMHRLSSSENEWMSVDGIVVSRDWEEPREREIKALGAQSQLCSARLAV